MLSTGGDEVNTACYQVDEEVGAVLNATGGSFDSALNSALDGFTQAIHSAVRATGKTPVVWEGERPNKIPYSNYPLTLVLLQRWC